MKSYKKFILMGAAALTITALTGCRVAKNTESSGDESNIPESEESSATLDSYKMSVVAPSGAPGVSIADLKTNYESDYTFNIGVDATVLKTSLTAGEEDVIIAPINVGAVVYKSIQNYSLTSVLTWGNLYFASQIEDFSIESLKGATLTTFGENTVNDAIVDYVLAGNGATVTKNYLATTQATKDILVSDATSICLVAEPVLSAAVMAKSNIKTISVQELYKTLSGDSSYPQAGCFIKNSTITNHKSVVDTFIARLEASATACNNDTDKVAAEAEALGLIGKAAILKKAMPGCNISYKTAVSSKAAVEKMVELAPKYFGGAKPDDSFYYM